MKKKRAIVALVFSLSLTACGGGGGGSSVSTGPPQPPAPTIQGDMMAYAPSRGWNYTGTFNGQTVTASMYADPSPSNGVYALIVAAVAGSVPTVLTSATNVKNNLAGALGVTITNGSYNAVSEISAGSSAAIPGSPLLIPSNLTLNQTWSPAPGVTATVSFIGTVPNASACPAPTTGLQVRYTYTGYDNTLSYVPGCGLTQVRNNLNGVTIDLVSVGTYSSLGQLSIARRAQSATMWDTVKSLAGLGHNAAPGAVLLNKLF